MLQAIISALFYLMRRSGITLVLKRDQLDTSTTNRKWFNGFAYKILADDHVRNEAYKKAIKEHINSDSRVLEIGCGDRAYLSLLCLKQNPMSFTAVEENEKAFKNAKPLLLQTDYRSTSLHLVKGNSTQVELPEKSNVLVQEIIGSIASAEGVALSISDAKDRFLDMPSQFIPSGCKTWIVPVSKPNLSLVEKILARVTVGKLKPNSLYRIFNFPKSALRVKAEIMEDLDFSEEFSLNNHKKLFFNCEETTLFSGFLLYLEVHFDKETRLNSLTQITNWSTPYIQLYNEDIKLDKNDTIEVDIITDLNGLCPKYHLGITVHRGQHKQSLEFTWQGT